MNYKLISPFEYGDNPIEHVLKNRGIENLKEFYSPTKSNVGHHSQLKNIGRAVNCLIKHVKKGGEAFVQVDADP
ncbi:hypothetical protein PQ478_09150 [Alkalihalophilus pseudofirmus]|uniref:hypothetical protein n=1 Tax=Alkalihalophilus pseudofirmus TaxID=79885 RepID=UPI00259B9980|nr:hypothetical protein [Alkalihalophilus pseudofirmus]WEG18636.1 hypothetical protein PQ478_09150 [Alkalihalophilus pseudofirmus]